MKELVIYAVDVGSVPRGNFGWARRTGGRDTRYEEAEQGDIDELTSAIADDLGRGLPVALGFEAPTWIPIPERSEKLGSRRHDVEKLRSWSAGAAATLFPTAVAQFCWIFWDIDVKSTVEIEVFIDWERFASSEGSRLFVWEAFVTGSTKGKTHAEDARRAAKALDRLIRDAERRGSIPSSVFENRSGEDRPPVFSLVGAALHWARWTRRLEVLETPLLVVAPK
jgi:hypothetical protein